MQPATNRYVPWKRYTLAVSKAVFTFTAAIFIVGYYLLHVHGYLPLSILLITACLALVIYSVYRMVQEFTIVAVMLMIPIAPLVILMIVVSMIHILQLFP